MAHNFITQKILADAEAYAAALVKDAKSSAAEQINLGIINIQKEEESRREQLESDLKKQADQKLYQAEIDMRKQWLIKKQSILDEVFAKAKSNIDTMKDKPYRTLMAGLIKKYGRVGDTVIVGKANQKCLSSEFFKSAELLKMKLTRKVDESIEGGIIISNQQYDLPLTHKVLLKKVRESKEAELAEILFNE